jgi:putative transposon-encoded protein
MKIVEFHKDTELKVKNIRGFIKRKVVISGTSAKVNVPKEYLGSDAYLIVLENGIKKKSKGVRGSIESSSSKDRRIREKRNRKR